MNTQALPAEAELPGLLERFYARVREDDVLGPLFGEVVHDWPGHLAKIESFWSSVMLTSGRYKGQPVAVHLAIADRIRPEMFDRWLSLWRESTDACLAPAAADAMQAKAARIAESLQLAMRHATPAQMTAARPRSVPYRSTPVFDERTLPDALRREHRTKVGVWGVLRVLDGRVLYHPDDGGETVTATPFRPVLIRPEAPHHVEPLGPMRMQVDFYDHEPVPALP